MLIYHDNLEKNHFLRFRIVFFCLEIKKQIEKKSVVSCICNINLFEREFYYAKVSKTKWTRNETINGGYSSKDCLKDIGKGIGAGTVAGAAGGGLAAGLGAIPGAFVGAHFGVIGGSAACIGGLLGN